MFKEFEFYHGVVFANILHSTNERIAIEPYPTPSNSSYVLNQSIGLYIKYSSKRMSPWSFSFRKEHQDEILRMKEDLGEVYVVLVCNEDGFVTLSFSELKAVLNEVHEEVESISVWRSPREMYLVKGSDGKLPFKVARNELSRKLLSTKIAPIK